MPGVVSIASSGSRYYPAAAPTTYGGFTPTLYAAPTDQGSGDGSSEANAMDFATAIVTIGNGSTGRVLGVVPGVYSGSAAVNDRWYCCFQPAYSGTSGDPIVIVAKYPAVYNMDTPANYSELRNADYATQLHPVIGVGGTDISAGYDNIRFIGFYVNQVYAPPRSSNGSCLVGYGANNVSFEQFVVDQTVNPTSDNYNAFYGEGNTGFVLRNNYVSGGSGAGNHNASVATCYDCVDFIWEHNEIDNGNQGFYVKGSISGTPNNNGIIRYNIIQNCSNGGIDCSTDNTTGVQIYQNLLVNNARGVIPDNSAPSGFAGYMIVYNNTIVDMTGAGYNAESGLTLTGCTFERNIVAFMSATSANAIQLDGTITAAAMSTVDDNLYYEAGGSVGFYQNGTPYSGLTNWQTAVSPKEGSSAETNPNFTDAAAGNYHRSSYADGRGCYITGTEEIGIQAA